ncbi:facilitated trehalose transporter Tret1-like [Zeugodacus cucurbitae]|uniref:facilitated trehalose transporter Tret1-like n=1 Tax=Zeugodacus cucurbitae TaxID=28588 RepID=UPI0023D91CBD|nr:facilitated trehalose transporter Tret1-like [Zeugodacus cucurbitae]
MFGLCKKSEGVFKYEYRRQLLASMCITITSFCHGFAFGWLSVILAKLQSPTETELDFVINVEESSWFGGMSSLGGVCGNIVYGGLVDLIGRKASNYCLAVPYIVSWILIYFANSVEYLYVGRFLAGVTGGGTYVIIPIFIGEIAEPKIRGRLISLFSLTLYSGTLCGYIITARIRYHLIPIVGVVIPLIFVIFQIFFPETPMFLLQRGRDERAKESLKFYRNYAPTTKESATEFEEAFQKLKSDVTSHQANANTLTWHDFCNKRAVIAFGNGLVLMWLNVFCGSYALLYYTSSIFVAARTELHPDTNTIIVGLVQVIGVYTATILVDRFGRRPLLIFSCAATGVGMTIFGLYGYLLTNTSVDLSPVSAWLPLVNVCLIMFVINSGLIPIPFVLLVELMPPKIRAKAAAVCLVLFNSIAFLLMKMFPITLVAFGLYLPMWFFALTSFLGLIYVVVFIKETNGMSLNKIEA